VIIELLRRNEVRADVYIRPIVFANSNDLSPVLDPDTSASAEHVFIVRDCQLISPPSTADNLDGITRLTLIALARDLDIPFVERPIGRTELYVADEVSLCRTGAEVTPVRSVDLRPVGVSARHDWLTPGW